MEKPLSQLYQCHQALFVIEVPLTAAQRDDMLCSCLYAQLAADKKHSIFAEYSQWSTFYEGVLKGLGSVPFNHWSRSVTDNQGADFTVLELMEGALKNTPESKRRVIDRLSTRAEALSDFTGGLCQSLPAEPLMLGELAPSQTVVSLQVANVSAVGVMAWASINFRTTQPLSGDLLHQRFARQALTSSIDTRYFETHSSERVFSKLRSTVLSKVSARKSLLIKELLL